MSNVKVRYYQGTINPDDLIVVEPPECKRKVMALCVSESGHITLNDHFLSAIDDRLFDFRTTKDRKIITLKATKDGIYTFPKNGRKKDVDFVRGLSACGLHLPCKYVLKYSEEMELWVGEYSDTVIGGKDLLEISLDQMKQKGKRGRKSYAK